MHVSKWLEDANLVVRHRVAEAVDHDRDERRHQLEMSGSTHNCEQQINLRCAPLAHLIETRPRLMGSIPWEQYSIADEQRNTAKSSDAVTTLS